VKRGPGTLSPSKQTGRDRSFYSDDIEKNGDPMVRPKTTSSIHEQHLSAKKSRKHSQFHKARKSSSFSHMSDLNKNDSDPSAVDVVVGHLGGTSGRVLRTPKSVKNQKTSSILGRLDQLEKATESIIKMIRVIKAEVLELEEDVSD